MRLYVRDCVTELRDAERAFTLRVNELALEAGDRVALTGPSGCGKTTLLELLALLRRPKAAGAFQFDARAGESLDVANAWTAGEEHRLTSVRGTCIGYVPQRKGFFPFFSAHRNAMLRASVAGMSKHEAQIALVPLARRLGLSELLIARPSRLSSGQRQRGVILQALIHAPALVIADEPTAALHPSLARETFQLLTDCCAAAGAALLVATHDVELVASMGFRVFPAQVSQEGGRQLTCF